jgi:nickel/cobalt exporter
MAFRKLWLLLVLLVAPAVAFAHPMGNFSVNHYSKIDLQKSQIVVRYFIDLAEIPTYQELQSANIVAGVDSAIDPKAAVVTQFVAKRVVELGRGLTLLLDEKSIPLRLVASSVIFPPGAGGLPTMKMGFVYEAPYPPGMQRDRISLHYLDNNYEGHSGWKEIIAVASSGSLSKSSVPSTDRSGELSNYPTDLLSSPPQNLEASLEASLPPALAQSLQQAGTEKTSPAAATTQLKKVSASTPVQVKKGGAHREHPLTAVLATQEAVIAAPPLPMKANQQKTPRSRFTELITEQHLSPWFLFTAALIAVGLGGLHALEPGHGKTIVAAYLVGSKGTARHAVLLGLIVTASHTVGVFALGAITLYASRYIVPEQLYPWLGVFSGLTIAALGMYMFLRRWTGTATDHSHAPGSAQAHWPFFKRSQGNEAAPLESPTGAAGRQVGLVQLFTLGITGGIIPCPAALIVLLSAFALHRIALGFFLIVAFSVGLAAVLIGFGMAMVYARRFLTHLQVDGPLTKRWLPIASSLFITALGIGLAAQSFAAAHLNLHFLTRERLGPLLFVSGLGLFLGMRHSTDADHVVAISTIVSKQRGIRNAAFIGSVWGLGHTITIFVVGSLIILSGVTIPPRLGLSMEFSVAIMLILLGVLNLTGVMQTITARLTPARSSQQAAPGILESSQIPTPSGSRLKNSLATFGIYQCVRPLVIGLVHGLAGSAAIALLVLSTIHDPHWAAVYLVIFGIGTMLGMMCMTAAIAVPLTYAGDRFSKLSHYFGVASGLVSVCFGSFLVYQLGFLGGLFTSHPHWTPQ